MQAAAVEAYRRELRKRYSSENVRRFARLQTLRAESVDELRDFFLRYIYPPVAGRGTRDSSFDELGNMLKSPRKLWPLFGTALSSIWKLGGRLGAAVQAGFRTLETYVESKRLENIMIEMAQREGLKLEDFTRDEAIPYVVRRIPAKLVRRFQRDMVLLFESLADVKLLESTLEIMRESRQIMLAHPRIYSAGELAGIGYGLELLEAGYHLFRSLNETEVRLVTSGIEIIERDWFDAVYTDRPDDSLRSEAS
jgi:hypothetical protein